MKNYDAISAPEDIPTKAYADNLIHVGSAQPTGSEVWIDTAAPDPATSLEETVLSLLARVEALEARLA